MKPWAVFSGILIAVSAVAVARAADGGSADTPVASLRDPFWPVGWTPPKPVAAAPVPHQAPVAPKQNRSPVRWEEARKLLKVTGLSKTTEGKAFAILKDVGVVEESDIVTVTLDGLVYKWRVTGVTEDGIVPEQIGVYPARQEERR